MNNFSRRDLIKVLAASGSMALLNTSNNVLASTLSTEMTLNNWATLAPSALESMVGKRFYIHDKQSVYAVKLNSVRATLDPNRPAEFPRKQGFSAVFSPDGYDYFTEDKLAQISHSEISGGCDALIMAKRDENDKAIYEIVFG